MKGTWSERIGRAEHLAREGGASASLLRFYAELLRGQQHIFDRLSEQPPSGDLERDLSLVRTAALVLLRTVVTSGPEELAESAQHVLADPSESLDELLLTYWRSPSDRQFFGKAVVQPYANWLAGHSVTVQRDMTRADNRCPFCGGKPQLAVLDATDSQGGGGKSLFCSTCLSAWPFPRVQCAHCGETDEPRLGYFHSPTYAHVRIEVCDACHHYQKAVDRSRLGLADPLVDEVATAALDLWAREHGYTKIEMNLIGL